MVGGGGWEDGHACLMDVTSHPLLTAALHIRDPRKPFPPQTTRRLAADMISDSEGGLCGSCLNHVW
jgi:hypothetical protein